jgi:hypothetical protein
MIFQTPKIASYCLVLMVVLHAFEGCLTIFLLRNINLPAGAKQTWLSSTFLLGYPVVAKAYKLSTTVKKSVKHD